VDGKRTALDEELTAIETALGDDAIAPAEVAKARKAIEAHRTAKSEIRILTERIKDLQTMNDTDKQEIVSITAIMERSAVARKWLADLDITREFSHKENFPKLAAQRWLEDMVTLVNKTLSELDSQFYVKAAPDLSFIAIKPNGRQERAERLSGGQKVLLAIAFRFAVNKLMAGNVGMMILDEPTAGVDKDNINTLTDVLSRVSEFTRDKSMQMLIITHDESLQRAFDQVITIGK
ncbi:MAG: hypothetical protein HRF40_12285, partial [Nitrososphaera sp.]